MDVANFVKQSGTFLKADVIAKSPTKIFTITGESKIVPNETYGTERLHITGELDAVEYTFDASRTNARIVASALGNDTTKWIGKQLLLETYKTKTKEGKMVDAINVAKVL